MGTTDTNNPNEIIHTVEFVLDGFKCLRFFDVETEKLCLLGPKKSMKAQKRYFRKHDKLCRNDHLRNILESIKPEVDMSMKINAILQLVEEQGDEIAIASIIALLDTWAGQPPLDLVAWCLATRAKER
jgi:hypothetical protein